MSDPFTIEVLDSNTNLGWNLDEMLATIPANNWLSAYHYQNNTFVCNLEFFPDKLDQLYNYVVGLQAYYSQQENLTPAQTIFVNSTFNTSEMDLYRTYTDTSSIPIYNNISKYAIAIGLRNSPGYGVEVAPTYPTDPTILANNIEADNFTTYPSVIEILQDNHTYIINRSLALRGKKLDLPADFRYLIVFFLS